MHARYGRCFRIALSFSALLGECSHAQRVTTRPTADDPLIAELDLNDPDLSALKTAVQQHDLVTIQKAYLDYRRTASKPKWKVMPADAPAKATEVTDFLGDETCAHRIHNLWYAFTPKIADVGKDFNWFYNPLPTSDPNFSTNWSACVIARTQFWEQLADAYWKTRDEKYAREWVAQLESFNTKVPVDFTQNDNVNYQWSPLTAANRMFDSWPYAYAHFLNSPSFTPEAHWSYVKEIHDDAMILLHGLADPHRKGNWITAECSGLFTLATLFPEFKEAAAWRKIALDRFTVELNRLVLADGLEAELSAGYHTSTIEQFTVPVELAQLNHQPVPAEFRDKLLSMYRALVLIADQSFNVACTNDSWQIDAATFSQRGLKLFDDPLLRWAATRGARGNSPPDSTMLPYAGFYAMRSGWKPDDVFLFFRGGPAGLGHVHEEDLKLLLRAWNQTLLVDPGTYAYDKSRFRGYVIGTASHSTAMVDGKWQHRGDSMPGPQPPANAWVTTPALDFVASTYSGGYQASEYASIEYSPIRWTGELDKSVTHTRRILFLKPYYALVLDSMEGTGDHTFDALFHLNAVAAKVDPTSQAVLSERPGDVQLALIPLARKGLTVDIVQGQTDPTLGWDVVQNRPIPTVRFRKQQAAPASFATLLYPYRGQAPAVVSIASAGRDYSFTTPLEAVDVALSRNDLPAPLHMRTLRDGEAEATAAGVVARSPEGKETIRCGWGISEYRDSKSTWTASTPSVLVWTSSAGKILFFNAGDAPITLTVSSPFRQTSVIPQKAWTAVSAGIPAEPASAPVACSRPVDGASATTSFGISH